MNMTKLVELSDSYRPSCTKLLAEGQSLGQRIANEVDEFDFLGIWLPDTSAAPPPDKLRYDVLFHPEAFGVKDVVAGLLERHLTNEENPIVIAETFVRSPERFPKLEEIPIRWFSCAAPEEGWDMRDRICVFLTGGDANPAAYEAIRRHRSEYPTVMVLTSLPPHSTIECGERLDPTSQRWNELFNRAMHILLGVCDERSFVVMSRGKRP